MAIVSIYGSSVSTTLPATALSIQLSIAGVADVLELYAGEGSAYSRTPQGFIQSEGRNRRKKLRLTSDSGAVYQVWNFSNWRCTGAMKRLFDAIVLKQQQQAGASYPVLLDKYRTIQQLSTATPSYTFASSSTNTYGNTEGYAQFNVWLSVPDDYAVYLGADRWNLSFDAEEI